MPPIVMRPLPRLRVFEQGLPTRVARRVVPVPAPAGVERRHTPEVPQKIRPATVHALTGARARQGRLVGPLIARQGADSAHYGSCVSNLGSCYGSSGPGVGFPR